MELRSALSVTGYAQSPKVGDAGRSRIVRREPGKARRRRDLGSGGSPGAHRAGDAPYGPRALAYGHVAAMDIARLAN